MIARVAAFVGIVVLAGAFVPQTSPQTTVPFGRGAVRPGNGIKAPSLVHMVQPKYTKDAMDRKVQGDVELEAVIAIDGTVTQARVTRSLDPGLDDNAIAAAKTWTFNPGLDTSGQPVPVIVSLIMSFRLSSQNDAQPVQTPQAFGSGAVRPGNGVKPPSLLQQVQPKYTPSAMNRKVQGDVELEVVIATDGTVTDARVTRSLDPDLDLQALAAAHQWLFKPGTDAAGKPLAVVVTLVMSFRLQDDSFLAGVCTNAPDLVQPTLALSVEPKYTSEALRNKIQGQVVVEAVVDPNGSVARARVAQSLDKLYGLDDQALAAAKLFKFQPNSGTCHGQPTATDVKLTLDFRIH